MKRQRMPQLHQERPPQVQNVQWELAPRALESWSPTTVAAGPAADNTISMYDPIGFDPWTGEGVTASRVSAALRAIGESKSVVVNLNSPGGDMFEGIAIYNLLRQHKGDVTVRVLGLAASAASVVAMAGDTVQIARAGFLMVHNCWLIAMGNRNDFLEVASMLEPFDRAMADVYAARTGAPLDEMLALMDKETWIGGQDAVDQGFADALLKSDQIAEQAREGDRIAAYTLEKALARAGMPRSERRALLQDFKAGSTPGAASSGRMSSAAPEPRTADDNATRNAGDEGNAVLSALRALSLDLHIASTHASIAGVIR